MTFFASHPIHFQHIPEWTLVPYAAAVAAAIVWAVSWILRPPREE